MLLWKINLYALLYPFDHVYLLYPQVVLGSPFRSRSTDLEKVEYNSNSLSVGTDSTKLQFFGNRGYKNKFIRFG